MAEFPLKEAIQDQDVQVEWMPFELRASPHPTLRPEEDYLQTAWANSVYPMAERMGIRIVLPGVSPQPYTHLAFEGFQYAKEKGSGNEYNGRVLRAFFQEEQDIGDVEVLTQLADEVELNRVEFKEALETRQYQEVHQTALYHAHKEAGISAVPTFIIEGQRLQGLQSQETLERVIDFAQRS